ncbi:hypothetical protein WJX79_007739 [Trebouxia sp. C0005]
MGLALGQLGLAFAPDVRLSRYWANAVLQPHDGVTDPIVLANEGLHCFRNKDDRLTGRAVFRRAFLAKHALHSQDTGNWQKEAMLQVSESCGQQMRYLMRCPWVFEGSSWNVAAMSQTVSQSQLKYQPPVASAVIVAD